MKIDWRIFIASIISVALFVYLLTGLDSDKSNLKIERYEQENRELRIEILSELDKIDSLNSIIFERDGVIDSLSNVVRKDSIIYIERKKERNEKIDNIANMSSDDKYSFFSDSR